MLDQSVRPVNEPRVKAGFRWRWRIPLSMLTMYLLFVGIGFAFLWPNFSSPSGIPTDESEWAQPVLAPTGDGQVSVQKQPNSFWQRSDFYRYLLGSGLPLFGRLGGGKPAFIDANQALDAVTRVLAGFSPFEPFSILERQFPALARVELESTNGVIREDQYAPEPPSIGGAHAAAPSSNVESARPDLPSLRDLPPEVLARAQAEIPEQRKLAVPSRPQVIVYHTHAQEAYRGVEGNGTVQVSADTPAFRPELEKSIRRVGQELVYQLQRSGVAAVHMEDVFDTQGRAGAYIHSEKGVKAALERWPSAEILIDLHRDGAPRDATTFKVGDRRVARLLFVIGTDQRLPHPNWKRNDRYASKLARLAEDLYPGWVKRLGSDDDPYVLRKADRYNQHLKPGAILVEVGGDGNSLEEAIRGAQLLADVIAASLEMGIKP